MGRPCQKICSRDEKRLRLDSNSLVIELASNDGYLLSAFKDLGVSVLGVEPADNVASIARESGIPTLTEFFGLILRKEYSPSMGIQT